MAEQRSHLNNNLPVGGMNPITVKLEETQLEHTIVEHYLKLASRTGKLRMAADQENEQLASFETKSVCTFIVLPRTYANIMPHWMVELHFIDSHVRPMGIEVADHVVLGVTRYGNLRPDLDLAAYGANAKGVSRRHALLVPSYHTLSIVDLGSTNGTWVDGSRIAPHIPIPLQANTVVGLGGLTMLIRIVSTPADLGLSGDS